MIGVDSTFVIDFLNNDPAAVACIKKLQGEPLGITPISVFELFVGIFLLRRSSEEKNAAEGFVSAMNFLDLTKDAAISAAELQSRLIQTGRKGQPTDVLIASICKAHGCTRILTRDKTFQNFDVQVITY